MERRSSDRHPFPATGRKLPFGIWSLEFQVSRRPMLWLQKLLHPTVIVIRDGRATAARGRLPGAVLRDLELLCADFDIRRATIALDGRGRCHFSSTVPANAHQRIRNVLS